MDSNKVDGEETFNEKIAGKMRKNPQGMGFRPNRHKKAMKGTGGTHPAKKHRGKHSSK